MNSSSTGCVRAGIAETVHGFVATCSQWISDARLVLAHRREIEKFEQSADSEALLEALAITERGRASKAPAFVPSTLLAGVVRRLGCESPAAAVRLHQGCAVCPRWRTCRAWGQGKGKDEDYRSFCAHAGLLETLPRLAGTRDGQERDANSRFATACGS